MLPTDLTALERADEMTCVAHHRHCCPLFSVCVCVYTVLISGRKYFVMSGRKSNESCFI